MQSTVYGTSEIDKPDETDRAFAAIAVTVEKPTLEPSQWKDLFEPSLRATAALTRLDERLRTSPIRDGYIARMQFHEAVACLWISGELVHLEDLVLHDAHMDIRAPTHELTLAHQVLRTIRQVAANPRDWAFSPKGLQSLRGQRQNELNSTQDLGAAEDGSDDRPGDREVSPAACDLDRDLADMDARLKRLDAVLQRTAARAVARDAVDEVERDQISGAASPANGLNPLIYDDDDDAEEQLADWQSRLSATRDLPQVLRSALALDDWSQHEILPRNPWLGPLLCASILRGAAREKRQKGGGAFQLAYLPAFSVGLRAIPREKRNAKVQAMRLIALIEALERSALIGLKEHDRLVMAREQMLRKLKGKRTNSKLPQLIELVLSRPLVTSTMIERDLKVTMQGALNLVAELGLREVTGRGRYRAWAVA